MPSILDLVLRVAEVACTAFFVTEAVLKISALGIKTYFASRWNLFDFIVVLVSICGILVDYVLRSLIGFDINPSLLRLLRVFRVGRLVKMLRVSLGLRALLSTIEAALPE